LDTPADGYIQSIGTDRGLRLPFHCFLIPIWLNACFPLSPSYFGNDSLLRGCVTYSGCKLPVGWKQQPVIPVLLRFHLPGNRLSVICSFCPYFVYIYARCCRLIYRPECNQLSGDICVLYRDPIYLTWMRCRFNTLLAGAVQHSARDIYKYVPTADVSKQARRRETSDLH
jgi:hypothetical protein